MDLENENISKTEHCFQNTNSITLTSEHLFKSK